MVSQCLYTLAEPNRETFLFHRKPEINLHFFKAKKEQNVFLLRLLCGDSSKKKLTSLARGVHSIHCHLTAGPYTGLHKVAN